MANELFNKQEGSADNDQSQQQENSLFFVGEGKKYHSIEELDKAHGHASEHIAKLEEELKELRSMQEGREKKDEAVEKVLKALRGETPEVQSDASDQTHDNQQGSPEAVEEIVKRVLSQSQEENTHTSNLKKVREGLVAKYGDKAAEVYQSVGRDLGLDLDNLSRTSPDAVFKLLGVDAKPAQNNYVPPSSVNTANLKGGAPQPGSMEEIEELYKSKKISREEKFRRQWKLQIQNKQR